MEEKESASLLEEIKHGTFQLAFSSTQEDALLLLKKNNDATEKDDHDSSQSRNDANNTILWSSILPSLFSSSLVG